MNPPDLRTRLLGSRASVFAGCAGSLFFGYGCTVDTSFWPMLAISLVGTGMAFAAEEKVRTYQNWKKAWDGYEPQPKPKRGNTLIAVVAFLAIWLLILAPPEIRTSVLVLGVAIGLIAGIVLLSRRAIGRRRQRASAIRPVAVCIASAVVPPLSPPAMHAALPAHCLLLMPLA